MFKDNKKVMVLIFVLVFIISGVSVFATDFGSGRYGFGVYGSGEEDHSAGGGGGGAGGGGGGGSRASASVSDGGQAQISLQVPNDLVDDVAESSFTLACLSDRCTVTANEVGGSDVPSEISAVYEGQGEFVAAVRLQCVGDVGSSTANIQIDASAGASCDGLRVSHVSDSGDAEDTSVECTENSDGSLDITATFSGCSYLVIWQEFAQGVRPTLDTTGETLDVEGESTGVEVEEIQSAEGAGGLWLLVIILVVIALVIIVVAVRKKKKRKF